MVGATFATEVSAASPNSAGVTTGDSAQMIENSDKKQKIKANQ